MNSLPSFARLSLEQEPVSVKTRRQSVLKLRRNLSETLPEDLMTMIRDKLLDKTMPGQVCEHWDAWCRAAKSMHAMCRDDNHIAWHNGCKLLGLYKQDDAGSKTWRMVFKEICDELWHLKNAPKKEIYMYSYKLDGTNDNINSRTHPWIWYTWYLKETLTQARGDLWLGRCASVLGNHGKPGSWLKFIALQWGNQEKLNQAANLGFKADLVLTRPAGPTETTMVLHMNVHVPIAPSSEGLEKAYKDGMNVNAVTTRFGEKETVLQSAVRWAVNKGRGWLRVVEWLLSVGADPNFRYNDQTWTPLMEAVMTKNTELVSLLLEKGADLEATALGRGYAYIETALSMAVGTNQVNIVEELLSHKANPNFIMNRPESREDNISLLMLACATKNHILVDVLIKSGANVHFRNAKGQTPLMYSCGVGGGVVIASVFIDAGAEVGAKDLERKTALMLSCSNLDPQTVKFLIREGADALAKDIHGKSVVEYADTSKYKGRNEMYDNDLKQILKALEEASTTQLATQLEGERLEE